MMSKLHTISRPFHYHNHNITLLTEHIWLMVTSVRPVTHCYNRPQNAKSHCKVTFYSVLTISPILLTNIFNLNPFAKNCIYNCLSPLCHNL